MIRVSIEPEYKFASIKLEYYVDQPTQGSKGATMSTTMTEATAAQGGGKIGKSTFVATIGAQPESTVMRYRIVGTTNETPPRTMTSPRRYDPFEWHAYFHSPRISTPTPIYHLFLTPANWGRLYDYANGGRCTSSGAGCSGMCCLNSQWNNKVPAVLVFNGRVMDVRVRYQGSRYNRVRGVDLPRNGVWSQVGPTQQFKGFSYRISLPDYASINGKGACDAECAALCSNSTFLRCRQNSAERHQGRVHGAREPVSL